MATQYTIEIGDEKIVFEGPDGLTEEQITALADGELKTARPGQQFRPSIFAGVEETPAPAATDPTFGERVQSGVDNVTENVAGFVQGLAKPLDTAANIAEGAYNYTLGNVFGESDSADTPAFQNAAAQLGEGNSTAQAVGNIAGATLLTRGMGGPGVQGAASGALMSDAQDFVGGVKDAAIGFVGGKIAAPIANAVGGAISPIVDDAAALLHKAGVKLTPGQAIPSLKALEDKMMSWPHVGNVIHEGRKASYEGFNRAVMSDILKPIKETLPETIKTGQAAIRYVGDKLSARYEKLIPKLTFKADQQLVQEVQQIGAKLQTGELAPSTVRRFEAMIRDGVMGRMSGTAATGAEYRAADKYLTNKIARYGASTAPEDQALAEGLRDLQGSLSGALARSNPNAAAELDSLNRGWSLLVPAEAAGANAKRGIFSADQYRTAVRQSNKTVRKRGMARGEARGQKLADAGSEILPSEYPDSGTAGREAMSFANPQYWQGLVAKQLYGPGVQNALSTIALSPRPAFAQPVAELVKALPAPQTGAAISLNALGPYTVMPPPQ